MATINLGNLTFTHKGDYAGGTAYVKNDVVYYATNGNSYIAKTSTTGNAPTSTAHWDLFVAGSGGIWNAGLSLGSAGQVVKVNSGGNALEFGADVGGKLLQVKTATNTSVTSSSNNTGGKEFPNNMGSTDGTQVCSITITPQSTTSHLYCFYTSPDAANGNAVSVSAMFHGTTKKTVASANCYSGDVGSHAMNCTIDTTSLSGAQTIQARNMGSHDGNTHYTCAHHGGNPNGGASVLVVMEVED